MNNVSEVFIKKLFALVITDTKTSNFTEDLGYSLKQIKINVQNTDPPILSNETYMKPSVTVVIPKTLLEDLGLDNSTQAHRLSFSVLLQENLFKPVDGFQDNLALQSVVFGVRVNSSWITSLSKPVKVYVQAYKVIQLKLSF